MGPYTLDFACTRLALAVELDGGAHFTPDGRERDGARDAWLAARGWRVLRVTDHEVLADGEAVLERLRAAVIPAA